MILSPYFFGWRLALRSCSASGKSRAHAVLQIISVFNDVKTVFLHLFDGDTVLLYHIDEMRIFIEEKDTYAYSLPLGVRILIKLCE